jgi:hypothetical protein
MRVHTTGAVLVSAQDKWAHPGFAGISGDALLRLYRATGRIAYLELLKETVHNVTQYVASPDRLPDSETRPGWVASPLPLGDAVGPPGEVPPGLVPGAAAASCLTAGTEIPSLYVHPDTGFVFAFDHVEVRVRGRRTGEQGGRLDLTVENPTRFETEVRILAERERDRSRRLGPWPLVGARTVVLGPGAAEDIEIAEADPGATAERRRTEKG